MCTVYTFRVLGRTQAEDLRALLYKINTTIMFQNTKTHKTNPNPSKHSKNLPKKTPKSTKSHQNPPNPTQSHHIQPKLTKNPSKPKKANFLPFQFFSNHFLQFDICCLWASRSPADRVSGMTKVLSILGRKQGWMKNFYDSNF